MATMKEAARHTQAARRNVLAAPGLKLLPARVDGRDNFGS